jgi:hypothetical protein
MDIKITRSNALNNLFDDFDDSESIGEDVYETIDFQAVLEELIAKENYVFVTDNDWQSMADFGASCFELTIELVSKMDPEDTIYKVHFDFGGAYKKGFLYIAGKESDLLQRLDHLRTWSPS